MHIERAPVEAQLRGRPLISMVSCCLRAGHSRVCSQLLLCLPPPARPCHRGPDPCFPRLPCHCLWARFGQPQALSGDWRLGEGRSQGISHSLLCPGPTRCLLCGSDSLMVSRATPVRLTPHQAPAWRTSRLLPDGEEPSSLGKRVLSLTVHPLLPASVWSGENSSPI